MSNPPCFRVGEARSKLPTWATADFSPIWFTPIVATLRTLQQQCTDFPLPDVWNTLTHTHPIQTKQGLALQFVTQPDTPELLGYEEKISQTGCVNTRLNNWHDLFNACVWFTFPACKQQLNAAHQAIINIQTTPIRHPVRDALTLFDECGVIFVYAETASESLHALQNFDWQTLFVVQKELWGKQMQAFIFGHALYEKGLLPYLGWTGHALCVAVAENFFHKTLAAQLSDLDNCIAQHLTQYLSHTRALHPLPLLGIPDWWRIQDSAFYANTAYFRAGRQYSNQKSA